MLEFIFDSWSATVVFGGFLLVLAVNLFFWVRVGRDPRKNPVIPIYQPPLGLSPAAVRFVRRSGSDGRTLAAALLGMAVKGVFRIERSGRDWRQLPGDGDRSALGDAEAAIDRVFFSAREPLTLGDRDSVLCFARLKHDLGDAVRSELSNTFHDVNIGKAYPGLTVGLLTIYLANSLDVGFWNGFGVTALQGIFAWGTYAYIERTKVSVSGFLGGRMGCLTVTLLIAISIGLMGQDFEGRVPSLSVVFMDFVILLVCLMFLRLMGAPTVRGRRLMDDIEGFRHFLEVTEGNNMNRFPDFNGMPDPLRSLMPYAIALEVSHEWSDGFAESVHALWERAAPNPIAQRGTPPD